MWFLRPNSLSKTGKYTVLQEAHLLNCLHSSLVTGRVSSSPGTAGFVLWKKTTSYTWPLLLSAEHEQDWKHRTLSLHLTFCHFSVRDPFAHFLPSPNTSHSQRRHCFYEQEEDDMRNNCFFFFFIVVAKIMACWPQCKIELNSDKWAASVPSAKKQMQQSPEFLVQWLNWALTEWQSWCCVAMRTVTSVLFQCVCCNSCPFLAAFWSVVAAPWVTWLALLAAHTADCCAVCSKACSPGGRFLAQISDGLVWLPGYLCLSFSLIQKGWGEHWIEDFD